MAAKTRKQTNEFHVTGDELLKKVKSLIAEGNVRKITIKNKEGNPIVVFPLTFGVIGAVISPVLAAFGACIHDADICLDIWIDIMRGCICIRYFRCTVLGVIKFNRT